MIVQKFIGRVLWWFYPLFAFLLPLQTRWIAREAMVDDSVWEYGRLSVYGFDIVLALIVIAVLFLFLDSRVRGNDRRAGTTKGWWILLSAALFAGYELLVSLEPVLTVVALGRVALIAIAGWHLMQLDAIVHRKTLAAFVFGMVLSSGLGAAQFFAQDSLVASKWLGLARQETWRSGTSVVEAAEGRWLRAHGTMPHPNALGGFSAIALMILLTLIAETSPHVPSLVRRGWGGFFQGCRNVFVAVAPVILLAGIVTAASRAAIIATVAGGIVWAWQAKRNTRLNTVLPWLRWMAIAGLFVVLLSGPVAFTRLTAQGRLESLSFTKRIAAFKEAAESAHAYGMTGTGLGAATVALRNLYPQLPIWEIQPVHNALLLLFVELGFGGLVVLCAFIVLARKYSIFNFQFSNNPPTLISDFHAALPLLACCFVLIMFDHYLWTLASGMYVIGLALSLAAALPLDRKFSNL